MKLSERQVEISEILRQEERLTINELADRMNVTGQTIRRDVNSLCDAGLARRRHGAVETLLLTGNLTHGSRALLNRVGKQRVAEALSQLIPDNSSVSIGIGTTLEAAAHALLKRNNLKVYTNNLIVAQILSVNKSFEINVPSGRIRNDDLDILGTAAEEFFDQYYVDFGIFGVAGVDETGNLLDFYEEEVRIRDKIRINCRRSILILDGYKFGRQAHVRGGNVQNISTVISDEAAPKNIELLLRSTETEYIAVDRQPD